MLVPVDDLIRVMLFQIALRNNVSQKKAFLVHDSVEVVAQGDSMTFFSQLGEVDTEFLAVMNLAD